MADESGNTVRDYVLLKRLGASGFGAVYLAQHRYAGQKAVVKISVSAAEVRL
jgi:serine/threonine protein kinase